MLHARSLCALGRYFIAGSQLVTRVNEKNLVGAGESGSHGRSIRAIADDDIHSVAIEGARLLQLTNEHTRPYAAFDQSLHDQRSDIAGRPSDNVDHRDPFRLLLAL